MMSFVDIKKMREKKEKKNSLIDQRKNRSDIKQRIGRRKIALTLE